MSLSESMIPLSHAQQFAIGVAAEEAYDKLRWHLGDSRLLAKELHKLARESFCEGLRQVTTETQDNTP